MSAIPSAAAVQAARQRLKEWLPVTRLVPAPSLTRELGGPVRLKLESELPTGSFKVRGALFALAARLERQEAVREVVASSTGNHGAAVAFAARTLGVPATIFLPQDPNPVKRARIEELGATVVEAGADLAEASRAAAEHAARAGAFFLNDSTEPDVAAGAGTIGAEVLEQARDTGMIIVPMGDTALIRGVAAAARSVRRHVRIVGVQAVGAPSYYLSWHRGEPVPTDTCETIADGLATRTPHPANVAAIRELVDSVMLVSDEQILDAMRRLLLDEQVVAEPAGAAATAAALELKRLDRPTVVLVTGANISPELRERVERGEAEADGG